MVYLIRKELMSGEHKPAGEAERPFFGQPFEPDPDNAGVGRHKRR